MAITCENASTSAPLRRGFSYVRHHLVVNEVRSYEAIQPPSAALLRRMTTFIYKDDFQSRPYDRRIYSDTSLQAHFCYALSCESGQRPHLKGIDPGAARRPTRRKTDAEVERERRHPRAAGRDRWAAARGGGCAARVPRRARRQDREPRGLGRAARGRPGHARPAP